jgi:hypothetical protein
MKPIAILILSIGMMGSPIVQAQEAGQGSAVPRQPVLVAQAGTPTSPGSPEVVAPAAPSMVVPVLIGVGVIAAVAVSGSNSSTNH